MSKNNNTTPIFPPYMEGYFRKRGNTKAKKARNLIDKIKKQKVDKQTLTEDVNHIIRWTFENYPDCDKKVDFGSLFLLIEEMGLKDGVKDVMVEMLYQPVEYILHADMLINAIFPTMYYNVLKDDLALIEKLLNDTTMDEDCRCIVMDVAMNIVSKQPKYKAKALKMLQGVLEFMLKNKDNDDLYSDRITGHAIWWAQQLMCFKMLPLIKKILQSGCYIFDENLYDEDEDSIKRNMNERDYPDSLAYDSISEYFDCMDDDEVFLETDIYTSDREESYKEDDEEDDDWDDWDDWDDNEDESAEFDDDFEEFMEHLRDTYLRDHDKEFFTSRPYYLMFDMLSPEEHMKLHKQIYNDIKESKVPMDEHDEWDYKHTIEQFSLKNLHTDVYLYYEDRADIDYVFSRYISRLAEADTYKEKKYDKAKSELESRLNAHYDKIRMTPRLYRKPSVETFRGLYDSEWVFLFESVVEFLEENRQIIIKSNIMSKSIVNQLEEDIYSAIHAMHFGEREHKKAYREEADGYLYELISQCEAKLAGKPTGRLRETIEELQHLIDTRLNLQLPVSM